MNKTITKRLLSLVLLVVMLVLAVPTVLGHLASILSSTKLRT